MAKNVGFAPAARGRPAQEVTGTTKHFVDMVDLTRFAEAYPHVSGLPHRIGILEATLDAIASRPGAVFAQGTEIPDWWEAK